jgi:hypothetical protein
MARRWGGLDTPEQEAAPVHALPKASANMTAAVRAVQPMPAAEWRG